LSIDVAVGTNTVAVGLISGSGYALPVVAVGVGNPVDVGSASKVVLAFSSSEVVSTTVAVDVWDAVDPPSLAVGVIQYKGTLVGVTEAVGVIVGVEDWVATSNAVEFSGTESIQAIPKL